MSIVKNYASDTKNEEVDKLGKDTIDVKLERLGSILKLTQNENHVPNQGNIQSYNNKLGMSDDTYLFRKERFEKYQSTMLQV